MASFGPTWSNQLDQNQTVSKLRSFKEHHWCEKMCKIVLLNKLINKRYTKVLFNQDTGIFCHQCVLNFLSMDWNNNSKTLQKITSVLFTVEIHRHWKELEPWRARREVSTIECWFWEVRYYWSCSYSLINKMVRGFISKGSRGMKNNPRG